ncbi:MAG: thaumatin family protein [Pseudomonadota bacterium]
MQIRLFKNMQLNLFLALTVLICLGTSVSGHAAKVTIKNNCGYTIYPGIFPANLYSNGGWTMTPGATISFDIFGNGMSGSGRLWGRTGCNGGSPAQCTTGQCGGTGLQCAGTTGEPNTSLFEFTLNPNKVGTDWYNISYVDAVNPPIGVTVSNKSCVSPNSCMSEVISNCPADLRVGETCLSPCTKYKTDQFCCHGAHDRPETCSVSTWSASAQTYVNNVHKYCPRSYSWAYDEGSGALQTCGTGIDYQVTFCPSGGAVQDTTTATPPVGKEFDTGGGGSSGEFNGTQMMIAGHAPNMRMDDLGAKTAPGSPVGIFSANDTAAQRWVFSNVNVKPADHYNIAVSMGAFCLDVAEASKATGAKIVLMPCDGRISQSWKVESTPTKGKYKLSPAHAPDKCLGVPSASQTAGTQLTLTDGCDGISRQWQIERLRFMSILKDVLEKNKK